MTSNLDGMKYCPDCKTWKPELEFYQRWRNTRHGRVHYIESICKLCKRAKTAAWKAANPERTAQHYKKHEQSDQRRKYRREYFRMHYGKGSHVWKKYAHEMEETKVSLPVEPFVRWLEQYLRDTSVSMKELEIRAGLSSNHLGKFVRGEYKTITLDMVDKVAVAVDQPNLLVALYPEGERQGDSEAA